jgi:hypothetical protein
MATKGSCIANNGDPATSKTGQGQTWCIQGWDYGMQFYQSGGAFSKYLASQLNGALAAPFFLELQQRGDQERGGQKRAQL